MRELKELTTKGEKQICPSTKSWVWNLIGKWLEWKVEIRGGSSDDLGFQKVDYSIKITFHLIYSKTLKNNLLYNATAYFFIYRY